ncbi:MAG: fasciclin domain-containing protein [Cohaesibacter sp.]|nr:fasciclin domain-containing protein [Cohaesibacter sp.]MCV6601555.1 fasciclin domain-containing protein [Cohaesibacter sp.]
MKTFMMSAALAFGLAVTALPASAKNIVEIASEAGSFKTLLTAAKAAGLADALASGENLTVFAPTDEAFSKLPAGTVESLLKPENKDQLVAILSYHVVPRKLTSDMLPGRKIAVKTLKSHQDRTLSIKKSHGAVSVDNASVIKADIMASNGVIHVIDEVVLPSK